MDRIARRRGTPFARREFPLVRRMSNLFMGAFAILTFLIVHVYMTTTGHDVTAHVKAMITGWEAVEEGTAVQEWERARTKPS